MIYVRELNPDQVKIAMEHGFALWGGGETLETRIERRLKLQEEAGGRYRMTGFTDDRGALICSLGRLHRTLALKSSGIATVGIGSVFTVESQRGQALGSQLLQFVKRACFSEEFGSLFLFSDISASYYEKLGYVTLPGQAHSGETSKIGAAQPLEIREAKPDELKKLMGWYNKDWPPGWIRFKRDELDWTCFRNWNLKEPDLILTKTGKEVGYLSIQTDDSQLWVNEWATELDLNESVWGTIRKIAESRGLKQVAGWLRNDRVPEGFEVKTRDKAIPMILDLTEEKKFKNCDPKKMHFGSLDHY